MELKKVGHDYSDIAWQSTFIVKSPCPSLHTFFFFFAGGGEQRERLRSTCYAVFRYSIVNCCQHAVY